MAHSSSMSYESKTNMVNECDKYETKGYNREVNELEADYSSDSFSSVESLPNTSSTNASSSSITSSTDSHDSSDSKASIATFIPSIKNGIDEYICRFFNKILIKQYRQNINSLPNETQYYNEQRMKEYISKELNNQKIHF